MSSPPTARSRPLAGTATAEQTGRVEVHSTPDIRQDALACPEAESAYLGCLMRLPHHLAADGAALLDDSDLTDPVHRLVLAGIRAALAEGVDPDPVTVLGALNRIGLAGRFLADRCAAVVVAEVYAAPPVPAASAHYRRVVQEAAWRRRVVEAATRLTQVAGTASTDALAELVRSEWQGIAEAGRRVAAPQLEQVAA